MGLQYSYQEIPTAEALAAMLEKSPITHAAQVRVRYHLLISRAAPSDELLESIRAAAAGIHTVGHTLTLTLSSQPNVLGCGPWEETGVWFFPQYVDV